MSTHSVPEVKPQIGRDFEKQEPVKVQALIGMFFLYPRTRNRILWPIRKRRKHHHLRHHPGKRHLATRSGP